jgi:excisionase family DNA binding protein
MGSDLWSVAQCAEFLNRSVRYVYGLVEVRRIPFVRLSGGTIRFRRESVERWLEDLEQQPWASDGDGKN